MNYGYFSIRTGLTKNELRNNLENSKLYNEYLEMVSSLRDSMFYIPDDEIISPQKLIDDSMVFSAEKTLQIDIMTSKRDNMYFKLNNIIQYTKEIAKKYPKQYIKKQLINCILINSISAFGNSESIKRYYREFRKSNIGILLPDYTRECGLSEYSTCNYAFMFRPQNELNRAYDLIERLTDDDVPANRGRKASEYSKTFRVAFWLYELFKIPEKIAVSMSGYSKNGFHMKADSYEQTINYKNELIIMDEHFQISSLIKRNRPVPENFDKLVRWKEKQDKKINHQRKWSESEMTSLERACIHCKVPMIFPVDYKRLILKAENGRKELARCIKLYDTDLLKKYDEWIKSGKKPTEFYSICGIEQYLK